MKPPNIVTVHFLSAKWSKKLFTINHYELQNGKCIVTQELSAYDIIKEMSPDTNVKMYQQLKDLICVDVLKAIQLLGFNYKEAIGEPLTQICANAILSKSSKTNQKKNR